LATVALGYTSPEKRKVNRPEGRKSSDKGATTAGQRKAAW